MRMFVKLRLMRYEYSWCKTRTTNIDDNEFSIWDFSNFLSRFRVNLLVRWSVLGGLVSEDKRRRFINSHNSFFLSHFFDLLLLVTR
jgi:hypothetical protein